MIVREFGKLTAGDLEHWRDLYSRAGRRIHQSPNYAAALRDSGDKVAVAIEGDVLVVFTVAGDLATVVCADIPLLVGQSQSSTEFGAMIDELHQLTRLSVYVPLVDASYRSVVNSSSVRCWDRSPNSTLDWTHDGTDLMPRVRRRGGSQLDRKRRLIERDGLVLDLACWGPTALGEVLNVDDHSWKAEAGQSLRQRGQQAALYSALIADGTVKVTFLRHEGRAIAFRMDASVVDRLMCLKWSYDCKYARYSPGAYLLTTGLIVEWAGTGIKTIDLFGGPDHMKDLIYSDRPARIDVWCGNDVAGARLEKERQAFDLRLKTARSQGRGLRYVFA